MKALAIALLVAGCGVLERDALHFDTMATKAEQMGGCVRLICALPLANCRLRPGRCERN